MDTKIKQAAATLLTRRLKGLKGEQLAAEYRPQSNEQAWLIQTEFAQQWCEQTQDKIGAWKCLLPRPDKVVVAPIFSQSIYTTAPATLWPQEQQARIEPELVFYFAQDLPAREAPYCQSDIDAALGATHMALELIISRYTDTSLSSHYDNLADCLMNQGLFVGPKVDAELGRQASTMAITLDYNGQVKRFDGKHPDVQPSASLLWIVEYLRQQGIGIQAGQAVITGSYAGVIEVPLDTNITINYQGLGEFKLNFSAHSAFE